MQLVAYGAQDIYLTGNPQITFFKVVYRRHTNFAMESIEQTFNGAVDFGRRVTATISRNGDLIKDMWLEIYFTDGGSSSYKYGVGNALVKQVEVEIGGQLIDRQYGEWMDIWSELSTPAGKRAEYDEMVGNAATADADKKVDVPLMFWFNRNPGLALPLIALQYHEVKINLDVAPLADVGAVLTLTTMKLWVDYIYLDTDERRRFAQVSHEYLIEQLQFTGDAAISGTNFRTELNFNHPCKELIWVFQLDAATNSYESFARRGGSATGNGSVEPCKFMSLEVPASNTGSTAILKLNGQDRFQERRMEYFRRVQAYKHHTNSARVGTTLTYASNKYYSQYIYLYSFALNPEEHQPSGTCNFSRIDNTVLSFNNLASLASGIVKVFAVNYNVLRIMSGMGGLAYSN